jgi:hypothetical protein
MRFRESLRRVAQVPWYPFVLGIYPALALLSYNVGEARPADAFRSILVLELAVMLMVCLLRLILRDWQQAAFVTSIFILLAGAYGQAYDQLLKQFPSYAYHPWLSALWIGLGVVLSLWAVTRPKGGMARYTAGFNLVALALVIYPAFQVSWYYGVLQREERHSASVSAAPDTESLPDIYFIVLDMYTRQDNLMAAYGYDNSQFINALEDLGFYVAECSASNYMRTEPTLTAALNMNYLPELSDEISPDHWRRAPMWNLIRNSEVRQKLEGAGYKTVAFATGYPWSEIDNSDVFLQPQSLFGQLNSFEALLLHTSWARALEDNGSIDLLSEDAARFRERTLFTLEELPKIAEMPGPTFAFAHILSPHPPFVLGPEGQLDAASYLNENQKYTGQAFAKGYTEQIAYISGAIEAAVEDVLANSETPPVIIIQGDHGPWLQPRNRSFQILNAYYLPDEQGRAALYPSISPVNSFRVVLNTVLGTEYELLADQSYFSPIPMIYDFSKVNLPCPVK